MAANTKKRTEEQYAFWDEAEQAAAAAAELNAAIVRVTQSWADTTTTAVYQVAVAGFAPVSNLATDPGHSARRGHQPSARSSGVRMPCLSASRLCPLLPPGSAGSEPKLPVFAAISITRPVAAWICAWSVPMNTRFTRQPRFSAWAGPLALVLYGSGFPAIHGPMSYSKLTILAPTAPASNTSLPGSSRIRATTSRSSRSNASTAPWLGAWLLDIRQTWARRPRHTHYRTGRMLPVTDLMLSMTKPRKPRKGEGPKAGPYWHDDPERLQRLYAYCRQDVEVERELDGVVPELSAAERQLWLLDHKLNFEHGFCIDRKLATAAYRIAQEFGPEVDAEIARITDGEICRIGQVKQLLKWAQARGYTGRSLSRDSIEYFLEQRDVA